MLKFRYSFIFSFFVILLLTTEFLYIEVGNGAARVYHFCAALIVLSFCTSIPRIFRSKVFLALLIFAVINLVACFFSDAPLAAFISLLSNFANLAIVVAVALILLKGRLTVDRLAKVVLFVTIISVVWGVIQITAFKQGVLLALSSEQASQIEAGFGPGFRTEANTFGKYMVLPFLLFLPTLLNNSKDKLLRIAYLIMIIGILMNFTRTALYGIAIAFIFGFFWYITKGQLTKAVRRFFVIGIFSLLGFSLIISGFVHISDYALHKIDNFFNQDELLEGGSSGYRIALMDAVLSDALSDTKRFLIGNGWGQTYYEIQGQEVQAGGGDAINIIGFSGMLGVASYLTYMILALLAVVKFARCRDHSPQTLLAEGLLFAFVGMFVTGQMSGYFIAPEYYLLLGFCIYFSLLPKPQASKMIRVIR